MEEKIFDIRDRSFAFTVRIVKLCRRLSKQSLVDKLVINQLLDAGPSVGANLEEAKAGQSTRDFIHKNAIVLKEARESRYWLRLVAATTDLDGELTQEFEDLENEATAISKIVGKIIVNTNAQSN